MPDNTWNHMCRQMRTRRRANLSRCHLMADGDICHQMTIAFDNAAAGDAMNAHHVIFYVARLNAHTGAP